MIMVMVILIMLFLLRKTQNYISCSHFDQNLSKLLSKGLVYCNEYKRKIEYKDMINEYRYFLELNSVELTNC